MKSYYLLNKLVITLVLIIISSVYSDTNKDREFINIQNPIPCIRRFNTTHQIGCANTDIGTYQGIVYVVRNEAELKRLNVISYLKDKEIVIVTLPQFFETVVSFYLNSSKTFINGIVLIASNDDDSNQTNPSKYSDDAQKPNFNFGYYSIKNVSNPRSWNLGGSFNMFQSFKIPMYVITDEKEADQIFTKCYEKFNEKIFQRADFNTKFQIYSSDILCGMELGLEMSGSVSSTVCTRRSSIQHTLEANYFCDPLGGSNYFTFLSQKPSNNLPITLVTCRIDTFTMYEYYTPAANEPISSIIGLLSLAELLAKHRNNITNNNILFVLFDNEAFDFGGSSRFVNDLNLNKFPSINVNNSNNEIEKFILNKANITTMIELGQLGSVSLDDNNNLYIHKDYPTTNTNAQIQTLISNLQTYSNSTINEVKDVNQELPPSSLQSFLRLNLTLGGILIADHENAFKNPYYHSVFDTAENLKINFPNNISEEEAANFTTNLSRRLQPLITSIAKSIYFSSTKNQTLNDQASQLTLNRLIYCFYKNSTCEYFKSILTDSQWQNYLNMLDAVLPKKKLSFYTSVNDAKISGKWITHLLLKYLTRNSLFEALNSAECNKNSESVKKILRENNLTLSAFHYVNNSTCIGTSLYQVSSVSPAFDRYNDGVLVNTDRFSAWTESSWSGKAIQMRLFVFTTEVISLTTIFVGVITFILSFVITYLVNKNSDKWFSVSEQTAEIIEQ